jgi:hypothetical protein
VQVKISAKLFGTGAEPAAEKRQPQKLAITRNVGNRLLFAQKAHDVIDCRHAAAHIRQRFTGAAVAQITYGLFTLSENIAIESLRCLSVIGIAAHDSLFSEPFHSITVRLYCTKHTGECKGLQRISCAAVAFMLFCFYEGAALFFFDAVCFKDKVHLAVGIVGNAAV